MSAAYSEGGDMRVPDSRFLLSVQEVLEYG